MQIYNVIEKGKKTPLVYYTLAGCLGVLIFLFLLYAVRGLAFAFSFVFSYWMFLVGGVVGLLLLRKILFRRKVRK